MPRIINLDAGIGWKRLAKTLQNLQKVVNANYPVRGYGITINETETGSIIAVDPKTIDDQINRDNAGQFPSYAWVTLYDVAIKEVVVVDPVTCAQSTITVYVRSTTGLDAVKFQAKIELLAEKPANI